MDLDSRDPIASCQLYMDGHKWTILFIASTDDTWKFVDTRGFDFAEADIYIAAPLQHLYHIADKSPIEQAEFLQFFAENAVASCTTDD